MSKKVMRQVSSHVTCLIQLGLFQIQHESWYNSLISRSRKEGTTKAVTWNRGYLRTSDLKFSSSCQLRAIGPVEPLLMLVYLLFSMLIKCGTSCKEDNLCLCIAKELSTYVFPIDCQHLGIPGRTEDILVQPLKVTLKLPLTVSIEFIDFI